MLKWFKAGMITVRSFILSGITEVTTFDMLQKLFFTAYKIIIF
ncbi:hypothetical protein EPYR_00600 [Erwinia pyrifoliae DSM 12163]|nr:hypothetical protein EPYR_00600 [Erwinia pyrifoliae DSM 12163]